MPTKRAAFLKCFKNPPLKSLGTFDTHVITHRYEVEPDRSIDFIPDVKNECIRYVFISNGV